MHKPYTFDRVVRILITVFVVLGILYVFNILSAVLVPFFISVLIAYLINPLVNFIQYKMRFKNRLVSVLTGLLFVSLMIFLFFSILIPNAIEEFEKAMTLISLHSKNVSFNDYLPNKVIKMYSNYTDLYTIKDLLSSQNFQRLSSGTFQIIQHIFISFKEVLFLAVSLFGILLYTIFILLDYYRVVNGWKKLVPQPYKETTFEIANDLEDGMNSYFRAQAKIVLWVSVLFIIGFKLIGLPLAIVLGISIGLLNFIPYMQLLGFVPAFMLGALYAAETGQHLGLILGLICLVFAVVQLIQETLLIPKIMGNLTGLNPAIILLSLSVWGALLGIVGLIIALPFTTLILSYYKRYLISQKDEG